MSDSVKQTELSKLSEYEPKENWGKGPWQREPDRVEFEHAGLPCLLQRAPITGCWCGYAAVPSGHPLHGKHYDDPAVDVGAHGGLTYSDKCDGAICHVPKPGEPDDVWWFGFDCSHGQDYAPAMEARMKRLRGIMGELWADLPEMPSSLSGIFRATYKTLEYARAETEQLAEQLVAIANQEDA